MNCERTNLFSMKRDLDPVHPPPPPPHHPAFTTLQDPLQGILPTSRHFEKWRGPWGLGCWPGHMSALVGSVLRVRLLICQGFSRPNRKNVFRLSTNSVCLSGSSLSPFQSSTTMAQKKPFERLPTSVLPKNYKLTLKPNLTEFTFTGEEVIDVEVIEH